MEIDIEGVNRRLDLVIGQYEDSRQEAWVEILESKAENPQEVDRIAERVRNKAIRRYLSTKYRSESLQRPLTRDGDNGFTLESVLEDQSVNWKGDFTQGEGHHSDDLYGRIVEFPSSPSTKGRRTKTLN
jgi:hypothetical protein